MAEMNPLRDKYYLSIGQVLTSQGFWEPALHQIAKMIDHTLAHRSVQSTSRLNFYRGKKLSDYSGEFILRLSFNVASADYLKRVQNSPVTVTFKYDPQTNKVGVLLSRNYNIFTRELTAPEQPEEIAKQIAKVIVEAISSRP